MPCWHFNLDDHFFADPPDDALAAVEFRQSALCALTGADAGDVCCVDVVTLRAKVSLGIR